LGKRTERLLFFGIILTTISIVGICLTVITVRFEEDRYLRFLRTLTDRFQIQREYMESLHKLSVWEKSRLDKLPPKSRSQPRRVRPSKEVSEQRAALGLPATTAPLFMPEAPLGAQLDKPDESPAFTRDYQNFLRQQVSRVAAEIGWDIKNQARFSDASKAPSEILSDLTKARQEIEKQPVEFLGIKASRAIAFDYMGANFQLQYGIVSTLVLILLGPLISGWLTSLYMTRQRELYEVTRAGSIGDVFPHIMNFVPVSYARFLKRPFTDQEKSSLSEVYALLRVVMAVVIISPMLGSYVAMIVIFWPYSDAVFLTLPFSLYIAVQVLAFLAQEGNGLRGVYFAET
jgi:hypothetical protein